MKNGFFPKALVLVLFAGIKAVRLPRRLGHVERVVYKVEKAQTRHHMASPRRPRAAKRIAVRDEIRSHNHSCTQYERPCTDDADHMWDKQSRAHWRARPWVAGSIHRPGTPINATSHSYQ